MMIDREKVIKALENCTQIPKCRDCPWESCEEADCQYIKMPLDLAHLALVLLKAQGPRLMTESDFDGADKYGYIPVWTEEKDGDMYCKCIPKVAITDPDGIGVLRYWTQRPTDEQREAIPWE